MKFPTRRDLTKIDIASLLPSFQHENRAPSSEIRQADLPPPLQGEIRQTQEPLFKNLPGTGEKCSINDNLYFTWEFDKAPKMGTAVLIIKLYDRKGNRVNDMQITGSSDMPEMKGAHDSGDIAFLANKY